jgi:hypothetical protein
MDAFRTEAEIAFRGKARDYFARERDTVPSGGRTRAERVWGELVDGESGCADLSARVLAVDEAACRAPRLGPELIQGRRVPGERGGLEEKLLGLAVSAGIATYVLDEGTREARARGLFASSLMGFRDAQERLAGLAVGAELLRLGALRVCRLAGRGEAERGAAELEPLLAKGRALYDEALALARELMGEDWTRDRIPDVPLPHADERTRP